jgi:hypothetical protein
MTLDEAASPWEGKVYIISSLGSTDVITRADTDTDVDLEEYDKSKASQKWLCDVSNGFFLFSAKQSTGGSRAYLALDSSTPPNLEVVSTKSKAGNFVARKDPDGGFELLVFVNVSTTSGSTTTSTPTLQAIDKISGTLKLEDESSFRFGFTLSS